LRDRDESPQEAGENTYFIVETTGPASLPCLLCGRCAGELDQQVLCPSALISPNAHSRVWSGLNSDKLLYIRAQMLGYPPAAYVAWIFFIFFKCKEFYSVFNI
jgi:hypothetical protein